MHSIQVRPIKYKKREGSCLETVSLEVSEMRPLTLYHIFDGEFLVINSRLWILRFCKDYSVRASLSKDVYDYLSNCLHLDVDLDIAVATAAALFKVQIRVKVSAEEEKIYFFLTSSSMP